MSVRRVWWWAMEAPVDRPLRDWWRIVVARLVVLLAGFLTAMVAVGVLGYAWEVLGWAG